MKRGTVRHPKLLELALTVRCEPYQALGLLESLLDWTYYYAPSGDVGRYSDAAIAIGVGWRKEPGVLIEALLATRWLDRCATHRC
jgi:hypothetical protein